MTVHSHASLATPGATTHKPGPGALSRLACMHKRTASRISLLADAARPPYRTMLLMRAPGASLAPVPAGAVDAAGSIHARPVRALLRLGRVRGLERLAEARRRPVRGRDGAAAARAQEGVAVPDALDLPGAHSVRVVSLGALHTRGRPRRGASLQAAPCSKVRLCGHDLPHTPSSMPCKGQGFSECGSHGSSMHVRAG